MTIKEFSYEDKSSGWRLDKLQLGKINLLVGASGAGKTQILKALKRIGFLAEGDEYNDDDIMYSHFQWQIILEEQENTYLWEGERNSEIIHENISINGENIVKRDYKKTFFKGQETFKLSTHHSIINILEEEDLITPIANGLSRILYNDFATDTTLSKLTEEIYSSRFKKKPKEYDIVTLRENFDLEIIEKICFIFKFDKDKFNQLIANFSSIFPQIEDAKFDNNEDARFITLYFKDKNSESWLPPSKMSSGMLRVFLQLAEIYLCPDGTVFLIDEFENSLGINCIDELTKVILNSNRNLQFVITSHHPYIINNIPFEYWKIVTRKGNIITTHAASEYNLGRSKHDRFMQLLQLEEYQTGITL